MGFTESDLKETLQYFARKLQQNKHDVLAMQLIERELQNCSKTGSNGEGDILVGDIEKYINDPNTQVWINHNNETGEFQYSVQVCGTDFWLNSFENKSDAIKYIKEHNLKYREEIS